MGELTLFIGGAKSGKTKAALKEAQRHPAPYYYLATAQGLDDEMRSRITHHQAERGPDWRTLESPLEPEKAISSLEGDSPVLMDCVTLWFSNLLCESQDEFLPVGFFSDRVKRLLAAIREYKGPVIVVSNELGSGMVPMDPMSRDYRDAIGVAHQLLAGEAQAVYLVVAGIPVRIK
ncbi:MAG: bifunctional adenosylcobinamide kinase/adenosylcobinamide-phosphate guanylyltransferase [Deltaproteobacteria bacterium]|jgi:adenosylcobinamide kinase/adenosylcobinamide-phosphate guanylyltransferase|nr:bifunctional adenosylcobinamide kinase/adenosylcobinamide-phosphate guanylyltransferase [Deltaproteobacteria bacterium]